jgi:hypothetical protein
MSSAPILPAQDQALHSLAALYLMHPNLVLGVDGLGMRLVELIVWPDVPKPWVIRKCDEAH